jgi:hypothetical protein
MRFDHRVSLATLALAALVAAPRPATAAGSEHPTFAKDVAPIFQEKCQACHRPGSMAPMSLLTYQDARPWARSIRAQVASRTMPPWHLDKSVGIQKFQNDRSLSDEQIDTILKWVDTGAPMGEAKDLPPAKTWPDGNAWQLAAQFGEPELIIKTDPYTMTANGEDKWWRSLVPTGVTEGERWVRAIEVRPSGKGRRIVHHVTSTLEQDEKDGVIGLADSVDDDNQQAGQFMEWAVGKVGEIFADDAGKLLLPGSKIRINVHYYAVGEEVPNDQVEMGVYLYPKGERPKYRTILHNFGAQGPRNKVDIAPGEISMLQNFHVLKAPARLENFQPHMHMRGKGMSMEAVYPDGKREVLSYVNNFNWNWHNNYIYAHDSAPLLPKGTMVVITAWHDNTAANKNNPDPRQWVGYGDRTIDEMAHAWVDVTYISQEDYDKEIAKRKAAQTRNTEQQ